MSSNEQVTDKVQQKYRLKKLISALKEKEGRGTELISLYIPPKRRISDVVGYLREEYSTASNIKSDLTRKHVQDAIVKTIERLKFIDEAPETGLVVFCGAIPQDGVGSERMEIYTVVPPEPINISLYRCDSHFHLEYLEELLKEKEVYGLISIDVNSAAAGILEGSRLKVISTHTSGIPGKHRAGGQSARRFERLREMEINEYFRRVARKVNQAFLDEEYADRIRGIIVGGPGYTKKDFAKSGHLDYRVEKAIIDYVDTNYAGEEGIREIVEKAEKLMEDARYIEEKRLVDGFIEEASKDTGLATYGLMETMRALSNGAVDTLIIVDDFKGKIVVEKCPTCLHTREKTVTKIPEEAEETCPACGKTTLIRESENPILDYLQEVGEKFNVKIEVVSSKTEYGKIFKQLGGIGAILRYRLME